MNHEPSSNPQSAIRKPQSRRWIWFFVLLAVLTVAAVSGLIGYNLSHQLKPEQVAAARALWDEKRPRDYRLQWTKEGDSTETFIVWVRDGQVKAVVMLQGKETDEQKGTRLPARLNSSNDMPALFDFIERFLSMDAQPGSPRAFERAAFSPEDGHLIHYVRSVMGKGERIEIKDVKIERQSAGTPLPRLLWEKPAGTNGPGGR